MYRILKLRQRLEPLISDCVVEGGGFTTSRYGDASSK